MATACNAKGGSGRMDFESETFIAQCVTGDVTHALKAEGCDGSEDGTGRGAPIIAFPERMSGTQYASTEDLPPSLGALNPTAICFSSKDHGADACENLAPTLRACGHAESHANSGAPPAVALKSSQIGIRSGLAVRRLTPEECEALQGLPRGYTKIPWRGKPAGQCPDGPRYKAIGNSWAVPAGRWVGERIQATIDAVGGAPEGWR